MKNAKITEKSCALRYAAGQFWLLDVAQPGIPYKRPMCLNEIGAQIWSFLEKEYTIEHIVSALSAEYDIGAEEIAEDVQQFINQLKSYGVKIEERV